jgi:hypothetical protein
VNTGQMLLTTAAVVLLGTTVLTVNRSFNNQGVILEQTEIGVYATSLATSIVDEASGQAFDENTAENSVTSPSSLTSYKRLGPEVGETTSPPSTSNFNDFDDYNGLIEGVKVAGVDSFTVKCWVNYIDPSAPNTNLSTQSFFKRLDVQVTSMTARDTVRMSYLFSYILFR